MTRRAIIYCRFSPRRGDESDSAEKQEDICRNWCRRNNIEVAGVYADRNISGGVEDRPALWEALDALRSTDVFVVWRGDRLARDLALSIRLRQEISRKRAEFVTVSEDIDTSTAEGRLMRNIVDAFSEYERAIIAERTKIVMRRKMARGERISSSRPYGWRWDTEAEKFVRDKHEAAVIASMVERVKRGDSVLSVAKWLAESGEPTPSGKGSWSHTTVNRILKRVQDDAVFGKQ